MDNRKYIGMDVHQGMSSEGWCIQREATPPGQESGALYTTPRGTCTAAEGLDAKTFRGFHLAGELFLLTSFFIEPEGRTSACLREGGPSASQLSAQERLSSSPRGVGELGS
jgi:hypothetical protein